MKTQEFQRKQNIHSNQFFFVCSRRMEANYSQVATQLTVSMPVCHCWRRRCWERNWRWLLPKRTVTRHRMEPPPLVAQFNNFLMFCDPLFYTCIHFLSLHFFSSYYYVFQRVPNLEMPQNYRPVPFTQKSEQVTLLVVSQWNFLVVKNHRDISSSWSWWKSWNCLVICCRTRILNILVDFALKRAIFAITSLKSYSKYVLSDQNS